ncbi:restriction endonuclease subunit S [Listeria monocytogenes]|nr:restriction endonuclease subunit S [Listeria monocytogenes]
MSHSKKYSPRRRFEKFSNADDWEQRKLNDMVKLENGYAFKSTYFSDVPSKTIVLTPGNVRIGGGFKNGKGRYYNEISEFPHKFIFQPEDIFVTLTDLTPSAQMLGYPAVVPNDGIKYLHNQRLGKLTDFKVDKFFLFQLLSTDKYHKNIAATAIGTTVKHSSIQKILQYETSFPSLEEQKNIGTFFKKLDNTIALHQRKLEKIKALKTAYLSEMFPAEGETKPKRRFAGFTDDWEQRKLGDHAKYRRGSFPQPYGNKEWYDGEGAMPFVQVVDVTSKLTLVENTKQKISKLAQPKSVFVPKGKVIVTLQGSIGRVAITQYDSFVDRTLLIFDDYEKETDERFWAYTIQKKFEIEKLKAPGGTIKTITKEALSSFDVHLPQFEEQQKIGILFKQLDDTITLHQRKLKKLQSIKKAYLNEMFI